MNTFLDRLLDEKISLDDKVTKLEIFLNSGKIETVDTQQITLLNIQLHIMKSYSQVLLERINLLRK